MKPSPESAKELSEAIESGEITPFDYEADDMMGQTDCPEGCSVEPDGRCPHGYLSAALTLGVI